MKHSLATLIGVILTCAGVLRKSLYVHSLDYLQDVLHQNIYVHRIIFSVP